MAAPSYFGFTRSTAGIVFYVCGALGLVGLAVEIISEFRTKTNHKTLVIAGARWLGIILGALALGVSAWSFWPKSTCAALQFTSPQEKDRYELFIKTTENYSRELGAPISCVQELQRASQGEFQRAHEIWTYEDQKFYLLYHDREGTWDEIPETHCSYDWCQSGEDAARTKHFEKLFGPIPFNEGRKLTAPFGATAMYLDLHQDQFKKIGWQVWNCEMDSGRSRATTPTFSQKFEHGIVFGVYRESKLDASSVVYVLFERDGKRTYEKREFPSEDHVATACSRED